MIYKGGFFKKEMKNAYASNSSSLKALISLAVFSGLLAFTIYSVFQTLKDSILSKIAPYILINSYYAPLCIYVFIAIVGVALYYLIQYNYLTFVEIQTNKWYNLVHMGFKPIILILSKLAIRILRAVSFYVCGFVVTMMFSSFLDFDVAESFVLPMFFYGVCLIGMVVITNLASSLVFKNRTLNKAVSVFFFIVLYIVAVKSGAHGAFSNPLNMTSTFSVFPIGYIMGMIAILFVCAFVFFFYANRISHYYDYEFYLNDLDYEEDVMLVEKDKKGIYKLSKINRDVNPSKQKRIKIAINAVMVFVIIVTLFVDGIIMAVSMSSLDRGIGVFGRVPLMFASETMSPDIAYNDLAVFKMTTSISDYSVGDIALFKVGPGLSIGKITSMDSSGIVTDITNYTENIPVGYYKQTINNASLYGKLEYSNGYLGLVILFANTTAGRILMLLLPVILLFFYKNIFEFISLNFERGLRE